MRVINYIARFFESNSLTKRIPPSKVSLPSIDLEIFDYNLRITKQYCDLQLKKAPVASSVPILRSYNPVFEAKNTFEFELVENSGEQLIFTRWSFDPFHKVSDLLSQQLVFKSKINSGTDACYEYPPGKIVVVDYEETVVDGASECCSEGFFDVYDLPPIDTWFYISPNTEGRNNLYAWIPEAYVQLTQKAIDVNCVDIISWFE